MIEPWNDFRTRNPLYDRPENELLFNLGVDYARRHFTGSGDRKMDQVEQQELLELRRREVQAHERSADALESIAETLENVAKDTGLALETIASEMATALVIK